MSAINQVKQKIKTDLLVTLRGNSEADAIEKIANFILSKEDQIAYWKELATLYSEAVSKMTEEAKNETH